MSKKRSIKKPGINIDMTPLVDVIMLLLTFFMLTATFKAADTEAIEVTLPKSVGTDSTKLPENDIMTLTLTPAGDIYIDVDNYKVRQEVYGDQFAIGVFHPDSTGKTQFETSGKVSDENKQFKRNIVLLKSRDEFEKNINDLRLSLKNMSNNKQDFRIVIKGDKNADFGVVEDLMRSLKTTKNTRFSLVTDLKSD